MNHLEIIRTIKWKDLKKLSPKEILIENNISLPWLFISLFLAYKGYYGLALPFSGFYFLAALRQVHNGFHNSLGTGKRLTWLSLYLNSLTMMASIHAVKFNHLRHHKFCLSEEDYEGKSASMKWYQAILYGPKHMFLIHWITFKKANKTYRKNMMLELASIAILIAVVFYFQIYFLMYHVLIMIFGEFLMAFFAVWTVHHDTHEHPDIARTQRGFWKNKFSFSMFYHMEHHLFPAVPTIKLPELAERIDKKLPELNKKQTF
ncbi:fatty acid desaturase family protein [Chryseobacterium sp. MEBOG07]|uniref:fatty acid desaturase family protein n=1 Tax=Chryseobacterium sp. MEBOG07 TaxID=2879939 RepID=UPI001F019628|nr:fatty acid desaturase [Chryseobacterium sp. MEBOG07]UKB81115.1 fatty acid desaturase [Chryseobacterium sp. MEBOG07]